MVKDFWRSEFAKTLFHPSTVLVLALSTIFFTIALQLNWLFPSYQNFVYQADGWLHGHLYYHTLPPSLADSTPTGGHYYWPLFPFPAVLLTPLVALFGLVPLQSYTLIIITSLVFYLCWRLARLRLFAVSDSLWLAFAFTFTSIYLGVAFLPQAWWFASAVGVVLLLAALHEYLTKRRYWLVGIYLACLLATRFPAALATLVPVLDLILDKTTTLRLKVRRLAALLIPIAIVGGLLLWHNYARFGNIWDTGYWEALIRPEWQVEARARYGLFNLANIPTSIYYYFFNPPLAVIDPNTLHLIPPYLKFNSGMGFFFLSPIFLLAFATPLRDRFSKLVAGGTILILLVLLSYYAVNYYEFGPRYLVDLLPLVYFLLLGAFPNQTLTWRHRLLITVSALFNLYLFSTIPS